RSQLVQRFFEADRVSLWLIQPHHLGRQTAEFVACAPARGGKVGHLVDQLTLAENGHKQVGIVSLRRNLCRLLGLEIYNFTRFDRSMIDFVNRVGDESAVWLMEAPHL